MSAHAVKQLRDFRGLDPVRPETFLSSRLASSVDTALDVNTMISQFEHVVLSTIDLHATVTVRMCQRKEPWCNDDSHEAQGIKTCKLEEMENNETRGATTD